MAELKNFTALNDDELDEVAGGVKITSTHSFKSFTRGGKGIGDKGIGDKASDDKISKRKGMLKSVSKIANKIASKQLTP